MLKINNKNNRTTYQLWTYFKPFFSVSIVNFEHVIADWEADSQKLALLLVCFGEVRFPLSETAVRSCSVVILLSKSFTKFTRRDLLWRSFLSKFVKVTSHEIFHYLRSTDLSKSFSQLIVSIFIFSQFFSIDFAWWG